MWTFGSNFYGMRRLTRTAMLYVSSGKHGKTDKDSHGYGSCRASRPAAAVPFANAATLPPSHAASRRRLRALRKRTLVLATGARASRVRPRALLSSTPGWHLAPPSTAASQAEAPSTRRGPQSFGTIARGAISSFEIRTATRHRDNALIYAQSGHRPGHPFSSHNAYAKRAFSHK